MSKWEVVGGADKGGILVRKGQDLKSEQLADRLSTGSLGSIVNPCRRTMGCKADVSGIIKAEFDLCVLPSAEAMKKLGTPKAVRNFFDGGNRRGEIGEFKEELNHNNKDRKKEALKKVIQAMTLGNDVSSLFPDVVKCMQTNSLDLKKLVYLYVINYAKAQPDLAILAINAFRTDANDPNNPLLRALAVRTMGCIRLEKMTEYLIDPLRRSCRDMDAWVRKTATICIAKLYDINPELVEDQGFLDILRDMLGDSNPMVVANAVASLGEISTSARKNYLKLDEEVISRLLPALNECSEWGQVFILDALATYDPPNSKVAEAILERGVIARLTHGNSAVLLSAVKVIMKFMDRLSSNDLVRTLCKRMTAPLVTMLSAEPEIQYVVMRNINLIAQKQPNILQTDVRMFVCKYNDPLYVKLEKIAVMVQLASDRNIDSVLSEFVEYASEVDIEVVRQSVRAIGQAAIKLERSAEQCVNCLLELIKTRVNYVVQEAIVVIRDIFRKYPGQYEMIISELCQNLDSLDEPDAKASMIWIVGEYAERIDNSGDLLETFLETFHEEPSTVQQQILTATVKKFVKSPQDSRELVGRVLKLCTDESTNPDLRDRGWMYWRLLSNNPQLAKQVVLSERPTISENSFALQPRVLDRLIANISTLASVYHQVPEAFCDNNRGARQVEENDEFEDYSETIERVEQEIQQTGRYEEESGDEASEDSSASSSSGDTPDRNKRGAPPAAASSAGAGAAGAAGAAGPPPPLRALAQVLSEQTPGEGGKRGLRVAAAVVRGNGGAINMQLMVGNFTPQPMGGWAVQFNKNPFGLAPPSGPLQMEQVAPNGTAKALLPLTPNKLQGTPPALPLYLEVAIKSSVDIFYFNVPYDLSAVLMDSGPVPKDDFQRVWQNQSVQKAMSQGAFAQRVTPEMAAARLQQYFCYVVVKTQGQEADSLYISCTTTNKLTVYCELSLQKGGPGVRAQCCSEQPVMVPLFQSFLSELLQVKWQQGGPPAVEELKLAGERLHYKRLTGTGPEEGWISLKVSGKELVVRKDEDDTPPEDVGGPGDAAGPVETDAGLKSKIEADSKAKKDEGALQLYCMKYKVLGFPLDKPKLRILCFHNAGSAESIYTGPGTPFISWIKESKQIELLAFDYPGRDKLLKATKHTTTETLAPDLLAVAHEKLTDGVPYLVWGHSVGTWVGFEFLMLCRKVGIPMPLAAFFVTFPAPHYPEAKRPWRRNARLSDSQFQEEVRAWDKEHFGGAAKVVFEESWKDTWEPMMRADFKLFDEYKFRHAGAPKFDFPLHCWWCEGEHFIKPEMVQAWKDWTAGPFDYQELKGAGHLTAFYKPDLKKAYFTKVTDLMKSYAGL
ncbi:BETAC-AD [Symbiodinium sp. CCMP2592]|nr:BETAC-AD [Symbiodinium sp. CCMP2592]